jgi:hypothetical protein
MSSAAAIISLIDLLAEQCPTTGAQKSTQCIAANRVSEQASRKCSDDQACGAVVPSAIIATVTAAIDAIITAEPPLMTAV